VDAAVLDSLLFWLLPLLLRYRAFCGLAPVPFSRAGSGRVGRVPAPRCAAFRASIAPTSALVPRRLVAWRFILCGYAYGAKVSDQADGRARAKAAALDVLVAALFFPATRFPYLCDIATCHCLGMRLYYHLAWTRLLRRTLQARRKTRTYRRQRACGGARFCGCRLNTFTGGYALSAADNGRR